MKLGILTQPLHSNYGGLLQAWALQRVIAGMGHEVEIIRRESSRLQDVTLPHRFAIYAKEWLLKVIKNIHTIRLSDHQTDTIRRYTKQFVNGRYPKLSPIIHTDKQLSAYVSANAFDGFIVGSDQVWRPMYSPKLENYFLDFCNNNRKVKKIAYAASFGVDTWEFTPVQTKNARNLISEFNLVTVREQSGIKLVKEYLGRDDALHVADPTMLLDRKDYESLVAASTCSLKPSNGDTFCYVLDSSEQVLRTIDKCIEVTNSRPFYCNAQRKILTKADFEHLDECIVPPVEQWIKSFMDAQMVITDSFHGTVFSIIFNRPFWVVANKDRGLARFTSLLSLFGLEDRIVTDPANVDWNRPIDWSKINEKRKQFATESYTLLKEALS